LTHAYNQQKQADDSIINTGLKIVHMKTGRNTEGENQEAAPFFSTEDAGEGWGLGKVSRSTAFYL